jgi:hypothetical protein
MSKKSNYFKYEFTKNDVVSRPTSLQDINLEYLYDREDDMNWQAKARRLQNRRWRELKRQGA